MANFDSNRFASSKQEWETPQSLFDVVNNMFSFDFDVCADSGNAKCDNYFTEEDDALLQDWVGVCWCNPPYGGAKKNSLQNWVKKAYLESLKDNCSCVVLMPARTNTIWWHDYCMKAKTIFLIRGRVKFVGAKYGLPQPLALVHFDGDHIASLESFSLA